MINGLLDFLKNKLESTPINGASPISTVTVSGVPREGGGVVIDDKSVLITLLGVEEEKHRRAQAPHYVGRGDKKNYDTLNQALHLNLLVLFSVHCTSYDTAMKSLSYVLRFFQNYRYFEDITLKNDNNQDVLLEEITAELQSLSTDQMANLWQLLGTRYVPSVLYKFRSITLQENLLQEGGKLVLETDIHFVVNDKRPVEGYLKGYEKE